jgi:hypothetical protein
MSIYVIPTLTTFHIFDNLRRNLKEGYEVRKPSPHDKNKRYELSGRESYDRLPSIVEMEGEPVHVVKVGIT